MILIEINGKLAYYSAGGVTLSDPDALEEYVKNPASKVAKWRPVIESEGCCVYTDEENLTMEAGTNYESK